MWEQAPSPPLSCHPCPQGSSRLPEAGLRVLPDWGGEAHLVLPRAHCTVLWLWVLHSTFLPVWTFPGCSYSFIWEAQLTAVPGAWGGLLLGSVPAIAGQYWLVLG